MRSIEWNEDDLGYVSCGADGNVYFYDLIQLKKDPTITRVGEKDFNVKQVQFTHLINIPGKYCEAYVVGNDRKLWNSKDQK